ncbi:hypothetical protein [Sphingomonas sp.]|uniref:hypothetical protein n=1 Tax=Sphingomonas sp. TaxID=28214 RepID=UPI003B00B458
MTATIAAADARSAFERDVARWWRPTLLIVAIIVGTAARVFYNRAMPLWFDETFTGIIAGQATLGGLWHWLRTELTGPGYYAPMWLWARFAGVSTEALRFPSLACTLLAPLIVWRRGHPDATMRLAWAAVLLLWMPAGVLASDARPYALLFLLGTLQIAAFCALMREPTRAAALRWVLPTLAIGLTHYIALLPGLVQGLMLLAVHRRSAVRLWPAAAPLLVLIGWMAIHLPFVVRIQSVGIPMTTTLTPYVILQLPALIAGDGLFAGMLAALLVWSGSMRVREVSLRRWRPSAEAWTVLAAIASFAALFGIGLIVPGMALRYFLPTLPGLLFALAWWLTGALKRGEAAAAAFLLTMVVGCAGVAVSGWRDTSLDQRHAFGIDLASRWLAERKVGRLLFFWSDTTAELAPDLDRNLAELGGFFLHRDGQPVPVDVLHVPQEANAVAAVVARADARGDNALLWVGNARGDNPLRQPDALIRDPRWDCRDFGAGLAMSLACRRR